jgi:membrane-associated phospholipid phosphatase
MLRTCCHCAVACSVVATLAVLPAQAQTIQPTAPSGSLGRDSFFSNLFSDTVQDFKRIPSKQNLFILGAGLMGASITKSQDRSVSTSMSSSTRFSGVLGPGELLGGAKAQLLGAVATQVIGSAIGSPRVSAIGGDLVRAQIVTQMLTAGVKMSVRRTRPDGTMYSFPSGHSSTTFATATVLQQHLGWRAGVPAYAFATYVAASRVQAQRHYLSDVAMGAALGIVAGRSVTIGRGDKRFALGPSVVPGGAGVNFTLVGRH